MVAHAGMDPEFSKDTLNGEGIGADPDLWKGGQNELRQYIVWFGKVRPKKKTKRSQPVPTSPTMHLLLIKYIKILL